MIRNGDKLQYMSEIHKILKFCHVIKIKAMKIKYQTATYSILAMKSVQRIILLEYNRGGASRGRASMWVEGVWPQPTSTNFYVNLS